MFNILKKAGGDIALNGSGSNLNIILYLASHDTELNIKGSVYDYNSPVLSISATPNL